MALTASSEQKGMGDPWEYVPGKGSVFGVLPLRWAWVEPGTAKF